MDKKKIVEEIDNDIKKGIYDQFPKLKDKLTHIRKKLHPTIYIINADPQLSKGEIKTLKENDYLDNEYEES